MKKYGLQIRAPSPKKHSSSRPPLSAASIFDKEISRQASKAKALKEIEEQHKKALEEDPSAFACDEVYDDMKQKAIVPRMQDSEEHKVALGKKGLIVGLGSVQNVSKASSSYTSGGDGRAQLQASLTRLQTEQQRMRQRLAVIESMFDILVAGNAQATRALELYRQRFGIPTQVQPDIDRRAAEEAEVTSVVMFDLNQ